MITKRCYRLFVLLTLYASIAFTPWAMAASTGENQGSHRGPPKEALTACASQAEQAQCSFTGKQGETVSGSCLVAPRGGSDLVCMPAGGPPRHDRDQPSSESSS